MNENTVKNIVICLLVVIVISQFLAISDLLAIGNELKAQVVILKKDKKGCRIRLNELPRQ